MLFDSFFQINFRKTTSNVDQLSILTFNTHSFNLNLDIENHTADDKIVDFIKNEKPDIICVQEFSAIKYKDFKEYPFMFKTNIISRNKSVMAIFSKYPIVDEGYINFPNSTNGAMYTDLVYKNQVIRLYNIHLQSFGMEMNSGHENDIQKLNLFNTISETTKLQKEQAEIIKNHTKLFEGKIILTGDFNSTQFSSPYSIFKKNRKDSFNEAGKGLGTTYKLFHYPLRLDFILCDEDINVISHRNYKIGLSDHEPILAELEIN
jgi:endonuclease/exonuclease/phosphatase family metal-dependent hydrolase